MQIRSFRENSILCYKLFMSKVSWKIEGCLIPNLFYCKRLDIKYIKFSITFRGGCQEMIMLNFSPLFIRFNLTVIIIMTDNITRRNRVRKFCFLLEEVFQVSKQKILRPNSWTINSKKIILHLNPYCLDLFPIFVWHGCRVRTHRAPNSPYRVSASQTVWQTHLEYGANEASPRGQQSSRSHLPVSYYKVLCRVILSLSSPNTGPHLWHCG